MGVEVYQIISLYKRNIPFRESDSFGNQYFTFGHFDSLNILPIQTELKKLWSEYINYDGSDRSLSSQPLFLARNSDWSINDDFSLDKEDKEDKEENFNVVGSFSEYPFIFIALLNRENKNDLNAINEIYKTLIKGEKSNKDIKVTEWIDWVNNICTCFNSSNTKAEDRDYRFACYYPFTNSQCAVRIHTKSYDTILHLLSNLQRKDKVVKYSFSISGLNTDFIKDENKCFKNDERKLNISFDIIVNDPDYFLGLKKSLDDKLKSEKNSLASEIIGSTDVRLTYQEITLNKLLLVYRTIINPDNVFYRKGAASFISSWSCPMNPIDYVELPDLKKGDDISIYYLNGLNLDKHCKKALTKLVNTVEMFEKSHYVHYLPVVLKSIMGILLEILTKANNLNQSEKNELSESIEDFLHYIQSLLFSAFRSEGQFIEEPGFHMVLDETPAKLFVLYHACLYEMRSVLPEENINRKFAFLVYPKTTKNMTSDVLFLLNNVDDRLFCIALPEAESFDMRRMIPQLVHEFGHCTGNASRKRNIRYSYLIGLIARMLEIRLYPFHDERIVLHIKEAINNYASESMEGKPLFHTYQLKDILRAATERVISDQDLQYKIWLTYTENIDFQSKVGKNGGFISEEQWRDLEKLESLVFANRFQALINSTSFNCKYIVNFVLDLARECFADLVMILALKMNRDMYLLSYYDADISKESLEDEAIFYRIYLILNVMKKHWANRNITLNEEESSYIECITNQLKKSEKSNKTKAIELTIGKYLIECRNSLINENLDKQSLLTEKLYYEAYNTNDVSKKEGTIDIIQMLLMYISNEV